MLQRRYLSGFVIVVPSFRAPGIQKGDVKEYFVQVAEDQRSKINKCIVQVIGQPAHW